MRFEDQKFQLFEIIKYSFFNNNGLIYHFILKYNLYDNIDFLFHLCCSKINSIFFHDLFNIKYTKFINYDSVNYAWDNESISKYEIFVATYTCKLRI